MNALYDGEGTGAELAVESAAEPSLIVPPPCTRPGLVGHVQPSTGAFDAPADPASSETGLVAPKEPPPCRAPIPFKVSLNLPFGMGGIEQTWEPDDNERRAAWELYVELVTLFEITRDILRRYGPEVARPKGGGTTSFGTLAVTILNDALRPLLAIWHPLLQDHEDQRPTGT